MSELEKKAKQLTDEELEQVTGGVKLHADKDSETFRVALGRGVNDGGAQGLVFDIRQAPWLRHGVKDEGSQGTKFLKN